MTFIIRCLCCAWCVMAMCGGNVVEAMDKSGEFSMHYRNPEEFKAVYKVLETYCIEGCKANIPEVKKVFHEKAVMNGFGEGNYVFGPIQNLYDLYAQVGPAEGSTFHVDVLDIAGNTAIGRCVIRNWHGKDFVDYHELIKEGGAWKIIAKIYNQF